ncbi:MAG: hypothetical protein ACLP1X_03870 [Polyangiaceae bacterium]|jgi:hypothetical protein
MSGTTCPYVDNGLKLLLVAALSSAGCSRQTLSTPPDANASGPRQLAVRVPAALSIARAIDALSVAVDPASLALTQVTADAGMVIGVEREVFVFPEGQPRPALGRRGLVQNTDFASSTDTWTTKQDGIPVPGTRYAVEMQFVLFQTDVPYANGWDPRAGNYQVLWSRTLRQAEE